MNTAKELILARLSTTRTGLDEAIGRLDQSMMGWAPREGMRTIAGQLVEIVGTEFQILERLKTGRFVSDDEVRERIGECEDLVRLREYLSEIRGQTLAYIENSSEAELAEAVPIVGWHESIGLPETPRYEIFVSVCLHEAYHVGQLVSYLWAKGDHPYEW